MTARVGRSPESQLAGSHSWERRNAFWQWWKICSISTTSASTGRWPFTTMSSKNGASLTSRARPLIRSVSPRPGTMKIRPTCGLDRTLCQPSARLLPGRSGMAIVVSSSTIAKPGGSPLGETSQVPSAADVAMRQNGEVASHSRSSSCSRVRSLSSTRSDGLPSSSRSSASVVTSVQVVAVTSGLLR